MSESGVVKMVFRERLSTAATADDVVERGFGLSVVQAEVRHPGRPDRHLDQGRQRQACRDDPKAARPSSKGQTQSHPRQTRPARDGGFRPVLKWLRTYSMVPGALSMLLSAVRRSFGQSTSRWFRDGMFRAPRRPLTLAPAFGAMWR
jgi:hypothetical protein